MFSALAFDKGHHCVFILLFITSKQALVLTQFAISIKINKINPCLSQETNQQDSGIQM